MSQEPAAREAESPAVSVQEKGTSQIQALRREVDALRDKVEKPRKDFWDKLGTVSALLSGILVALIGFYATQVYSRRQREAEEARKERELTVLQVQTVEKFFPHLSSGDDAKMKAAIQAIAALGNEDLATNVARIFGGSGSAAALSKLASLPGSRVAKSAEAALSELFAAVRSSVVRIESQGRLVASGFFVTSGGLVVTTAHVASGLTTGATQIKTASDETVAAVVVREDRERDLALLRAEMDKDVVPIDLAAASVALGSQVIALGQSAEAEWLAAVGTVSGQRGTGPSGFKQIAVSLRSMPGFSGAPVLSVQGTLVGVVQAYARDSGLTFLIPAEEVRSAFKEEISSAA